MVGLLQPTFDRETDATIDFKRNQRTYLYCDNNHCCYINIL